VLALVLLNTLEKSRYLEGILSRSARASEAGVVFSEDNFSWKVSELSSSQMQAKAAVFTRAVYRAFNFGGVGGSTRGSEIGVGKVAVATRAMGDVGIAEVCGM
jgi:hypothetical protein